FSPPHHPPPPQLHPLSLHDALPISRSPIHGSASSRAGSRFSPSPRCPHAAPTTPRRKSRSRCATDASSRKRRPCPAETPRTPSRSEEHTSELQSRGHLVCRLLLEKK